MNKETISKTICCFLTFLILSIIVIVPIQAADTTKETSVPQITKNPDGTYGYETKNIKVVIKETSNGNHITTMTFNNGSVITKTTFETINNGSERALLVNGVEISTFKLNQTQSQPAALVSSLDDQDLSLTVDNYWWDGYQFVSGTGIDYPHVYRTPYDIDINSDWSSDGYQLNHNQMNKDLSQEITQSLWIIGPVIGAAIGAKGGVYTAIAGAIIGELFALYIYFTYGAQALDETDNIWWWISLAFENWVFDNAWIAIFDPNYFSYMAGYEFLSSGYLRVGPQTFYDAIGAGDPSPPPPPPNHFWVDSVTSAPWGSGVVSNPAGLIGDSNDGNWAHIYGQNAYDGGQIVGAMNGVASGEISIYCYSAAGYSHSRLYVYTSYWNNNDWTQRYAGEVTSSSPDWKWVGHVDNFRYIAIACLHDNGYPTNIYFDCVYVEHAGG